MDFKAQWLHVWGTRHGWMTDAVVLWGGGGGEAEALLWQTSLNISNRGARIPDARSPGRLNFVLWPPITAISLLSSSRKCQIAEVHGSLENCGSSGWNLLHVTIMAPRIWGWLLKVQKICVPLYQKHENNTLTADYILDMRYIHIYDWGRMVA